MGCNICGKDCGPQPPSVTAVTCSSACMGRLLGASARDDLHGCDRCYGYLDEVGPTSPIHHERYQDVCESCREELT